MLHLGTVTTRTPPATKLEILKANVKTQYNDSVEEIMKECALRLSKISTYSGPVVQVQRLTVTLGEKTDSLAIGICAGLAVLYVYESILAKI